MWACGTTVIRITRPLLRHSLPVTRLTVSLARPSDIEAMRGGKQVLCLIVLVVVHSGSAAAQREVAFEWLSADDETGFILHLGAGPGAYEQRLDLGGVPADPDGICRSAVVLEDLSDYYAAMSAYNDAGESELSNEIYVAASACDVSACDDGNACTADDCTADGCSTTILSNGTPCGADGICTAGVCVVAQCWEAQDCDDGDPCNGTELCTGDGLCLAGEPLDCGQPTQCAVPMCDPDLGCTMLALPDGTACDDGDSRTRKDRCVAGTCQGTLKSKRGRGRKR
jgi:hypothetical protein